MDNIRIAKELLYLAKEIVGIRNNQKEPNAPPQTTESLLIHDNQLPNEKEKFILDMFNAYGKMNSIPELIAHSTYKNKEKVEESTKPFDFSIDFNKLSTFVYNISKKDLMEIIKKKEFVDLCKKKIKDNLLSYFVPSSQKDDSYKDLISIELVDTCNIRPASDNYNNTIDVNNGVITLHLVIDFDMSVASEVELRKEFLKLIYQGALVEEPVIRIEEKTHVQASDDYSLLFFMDYRKNPGGKLADMKEEKELAEFIKTFPNISDVLKDAIKHQFSSANYFNQSVKDLLFNIIKDREVFFNGINTDRDDFEIICHVKITEQECENLRSNK